MSEVSAMQERMDTALNDQVEELYRTMGTSFAEAISDIARQSVEENTMPSERHVPFAGRKRQLGIADGEYRIPDDIDWCNDEIAVMFGVNK